MSVERIILFLATLCLALPAMAGLNIQHWSLPNGARAYFVENHDLPMVDVSVDFAAGSARDSATASGLAGLTNRLMSLGAGPWSEQQIAERLADVGAVLSGRFDQDRGGYALRTLSSAPEKTAALEVLKSVLVQPRFDNAVVTREIQRSIASLQEASVKPEFQGERAFQAAIYGRHPYALPEEGEMDSLGKLTPADLRAFHDKYYVAPNMVVAIMGDMSRAEAEALVETIATALPRGAAAPTLPEVPALAAASERLIEHHATQSHLFMGAPGMSRDDPDYFPLLVGNYVLGGGGFDSRIMIEIRQKRGLAYSAYSYFSPLQKQGPFQIGLQTRRDATDEAVRVARETLRHFVESGPTEAELTQARNNLVGGFPLRLDSNKKIHEYLALIGFYRLPLDWLERYPKAVQTVTREDVIRAFKARVLTDRMATVIVGGQVEPAKK
jgi:zinc protease